MNSPTRMHFYGHPQPALKISAVLAPSKRTAPVKRARKPSEVIGVDKTHYLRGFGNKVTAMRALRHGFISCCLDQFATSS